MTIARLIAGRDQRIVHCTPQETVRDAARRYTDPERYVQVTLLPAGGPAADPGEDVAGTELRR